LAPPALPWPLAQRALGPELVLVLAVRLLPAAVPTSAHFRRNRPAPEAKPPPAKTTNLFFMVSSPKFAKWPLDPTLSEIRQNWILFLLSVNSCVDNDTYAENLIQKTQPIALANRACLL